MIQYKLHSFFPLPLLKPSSNNLPQISLPGYCINQVISNLNPEVGIRFETKSVLVEY